MDVILDYADQLVFDKFYSSLPAVSIPNLTDGIVALPSLLASFHASLSTLSVKDGLSLMAQGFVDHSQAGSFQLNHLARDSILRQSFSLFWLTFFGACLMYFVFSSLSYFLMFDKTQMKHPKFLKNQIKLEIQMSCVALPWIALMTFPWFLGEVRGYSRLYTDIHSTHKMAGASPADILRETVGGTASAASTIANISDATSSLSSTLGPLAPLVEPLLDGWAFVAISIAAFLFFTDCGIYWIHRLLHHPFVYKRLHKPHHKWIIPTPYASHAFHPVDGYLQSVPYHLFVFVFPMQKYIYLGMFVFVNLWSVLIHDGEFLMPNEVVNGAAHHSIHHLYFNYNYGQYFTFWDRVGGSYRVPTEEQLNPKKRMDKKTWSQQAKAVETFDENGKPTAASGERFLGPSKAKSVKA
ncbi:c-5 sterol desaturase [Actinomortierella ambigua]|nr:c-5 sterol desaturase [Actinomortierella ambigua]